MANLTYPNADAHISSSGSRSVAVERLAHALPSAPFPFSEERVGGHSLSFIVHPSPRSTGRRALRPTVGEGATLR